MSTVPVPMNIASSNDQEPEAEVKVMDPQESEQTVIDTGASSPPSTWSQKLSWKTFSMKAPEMKAPSFLKRSLTSGGTTTKSATSKLPTVPCSLEFPLEDDKYTTVVEKMFQEAETLLSFGGWHKEKGKAGTSLESALIEGTKFVICRASHEIPYPAEHVIDWCGSWDRGYAAIDPDSKHIPPVKTFEWAPGTLGVYYSAIKLPPPLSAREAVTLNALDLSRLSFLSTSVDYPPYPKRPNGPKNPPVRLLNAFCMRAEPLSESSCRLVTTSALDFGGNFPVSITNFLQKNFFFPMYDRVKKGLDKEAAAKAAPNADTVSAQGATPLVPSTSAGDSAVGASTIPGVPKPAGIEGTSSSTSDSEVNAAKKEKHEDKEEAKPETTAVLAEAEAVAMGGWEKPAGDLVPGPEQVAGKEVLGMSEVTNVEAAVVEGLGDAGGEGRGELPGGEVEVGVATETKFVSVVSEVAIPKAQGMGDKGEVEVGDAAAGEGVKEGVVVEVAAGAREVEVKAAAAREGLEGVMAAPPGAREAKKVEAVVI